MTYRKAAARDWAKILGKRSGKSVMLPLMLSLTLCSLVPIGLGLAVASGPRSFALIRARVPRAKAEGGPIGRLSR